MLGCFPRGPYNQNFFAGLSSSDIQCDPDCEGHEEHDVFFTIRWFKHILPKMRNKKVLPYPSAQTECILSRQKILSQDKKFIFAWEKDRK